MVKRFKETGHLVFRKYQCRESRDPEAEEGRKHQSLQRRFYEHTTLVPTMHFVNQLNVYGAVASWYYQFGSTEEEKGRASTLLDNKISTKLKPEEVQLLVSPTRATGNRMERNRIWLPRGRNWLKSWSWRTNFISRSRFPFYRKLFRTISIFLELISRFEFDFRRCGNFFLTIRFFWCVRGSVTCDETVHMHVLWPVCTHTIPFRMLLCFWWFTITFFKITFFIKICICMCMCVCVHQYVFVYAYVNVFENV